MEDNTRVITRPGTPDDAFRRALPRLQQLLPHFLQTGRVCRLQLEAKLQFAQSMPAAVELALTPVVGELVARAWTSTGVQEVRGGKGIR
jgi:hypothetical protein